MKQSHAAFSVCAPEMNYGQVAQVRVIIILCPDPISLFGFHEAQLSRSKTFRLTAFIGQGLTRVHQTDM